MLLFLDLLLLLVLVIFALVGRHKGFVKTALSLLVIVLSFFLSFLLSGVLSDLIFDGFISSGVKNSVKNVLSATVDISSDEIYEKMPEYIVTAADAVGVELKDIIDEGISRNTEGYAERISQTVTDTVVRPPVTAVIRVIVFIILFIVLRIVLGLVAKVLNIVSYIPVLRSMDSALGLLLGFINGLFTLAAVCFGLSAVVLWSGGIFGITSETLQNSFMIRFYDLFLNII